MPKLAFGGGGLIDAGQHSVFAINVELGQSSGGFTQLTVDFQVASGQFVGRTFRQWLNAGMGNIDSLLGACDLPRDDAGDWVYSEDWSEVIGVLVVANATHETFEGKTNLRVNDFLPNDPIGARFEGTAAEDDQF